MEKQLKECLTERGRTCYNRRQRSYEADDFFPPNFSVSSASEIEWNRKQLQGFLPLSLYTLSRAGYYEQEVEPGVGRDHNDSHYNNQPLIPTHLRVRQGSNMSRDPQRPSPQKTKDTSSPASYSLAGAKLDPFSAESSPLMASQNPIDGAASEQTRLEAFFSQMDKETSERVLRQLLSADEKKQTTEYDDIQPICLQDPPKAKFKRQLSSDASDDNQTKSGDQQEYQFVVSTSQNASGFTAQTARHPPQSPRKTSSYTRPPPQSPRMTSSSTRPPSQSPRMTSSTRAPSQSPIMTSSTRAPSRSSSMTSSSTQSCSHGVPATPQPEQAESRFDFDSVIKSPKRLKPDGHPPNSRLHNAGPDQQKSVFIFPSNTDEENVSLRGINRFHEAAHQNEWSQDSYSKNSNFAESYWRASKRESQCVDYMDCEPSPQVSLPCQHLHGYPPHRNPPFDFPAATKQPNLMYGDLPSPNSDMLTTLLARLSPQKERRHAFRSQSNIDHSPSKQDLHEMEKHKFPRSMSKPEGPLTKAQMQRWLHHYKSFGSRGVENSCFARPNYKPPVNRQRSECEADQLYPYAMEQDSTFLGDVRRNLFSEESSSSTGYARSNGNYLMREKIKTLPFGSDTTESSSFDPDDDVKYDVYIIPRDTCSQSPINIEEQLLLKTGSSFPVLENTSRRRSATSDRDLSRLFSPYKSSDGSPLKRQQKRKGDIDIKIRCQKIIDSQASISDRLRQMHQSDERDCACQTVEANILRLARDAFSKIRRKSDKPEDHERYQTEIQKTNDRILEALGIGVKLKELCAHNRKVKDLFTGSVVITMNCPTLGALQSLWDLFKAGGLKAIISREFITRQLKEEVCAKDIFLSVLIEEEEFKSCWDGLERDVIRERTPLSRSSISVSKLSPFKREVKSTENLDNIPSPSSPVLTPVRCRSTPVLAGHSPLSSPSCLTRSPSTPTRQERKFSFSAGDQSPRKAFQQRNFGEPPCSPTKRYHQELQWVLAQQVTSPRSPKSPKFMKSLENISDDQENTFPRK